MFRPIYRIEGSPKTESLANVRVNSSYFPVLVEGFPKVDGD